MLNSQVNLEDKFSPLHVSILRAKAVSFRQGLSKKMVEYGADPGVKTGKGRNCLHLCAETGLMGLFLFIRDEYGLDLDEKDFKGFSPLYLAISERREDMALLILSLSKGLKVDVKLAMQAAVQTGNYKITRNLLLHRREESLDVKNLEKSDDKAINKLLVILTKNNPKADQKSLKFFFLLIFGLLTKYSSTVYFILFKDQDYFEMISFSINSAKLVSLFITLVLVLVLNQIDPGTEVRNEKVTLMVKNI
jgi:ankyrin repeat protein